MAPETIRVDGSGGVAVFVRAKRNGYGLRNKILSTAAQLSALDSGPRVPDVWAIQNATLHHCIVSWQGDGLPPHRSGERFPLSAIDELDDDFGDVILAKINEVNKVPDSDPKDTTTGDDG